MTVLAATAWKTNAEMIAEVRDVGYLADEWLTLDMTYGRGTFWNEYRPPRLVTNDLGKGTPDLRFDMRRSPFRDDTFDVVVVDPPYKLNGSPTEGVDERYGVEVPTTRDGRHELMFSALDEAMRVVKPLGFILYKCQAQVNSGRVWWQPRMIAERAERCGFWHKDEFVFLAYRPQPAFRKVNCTTCRGSGKNPIWVALQCGICEGLGKVFVPTEQQHAARNYSTLVVLRAPKVKVPALPAEVIEAPTLTDAEAAELRDRWLAEHSGSQGTLL